MPEFPTAARVAVAADHGSHDRGRPGRGQLKGTDISQPWGKPIVEASEPVRTFNDERFRAQRTRSLHAQKNTVRHICLAGFHL